MTELSTLLENVHTVEEFICDDTIIPQTTTVSFDKPLPCFVSDVRDISNSVCFVLTEMKLHDCPPFRPAGSNFNAIKDDTFYVQTIRFTPPKHVKVVYLYLYRGCYNGDLWTDLSSNKPFTIVNHNGITYTIERFLSLCSMHTQLYFRFDVTNDPESEIVFSIKHHYFIQHFRKHIIMHMLPESPIVDGSVQYVYGMMGPRKWYLPAPEAPEVCQNCQE